MWTSSGFQEVYYKTFNHSLVVGNQFIVAGRQRMSIKNTFWWRRLSIGRACTLKIGVATRGGNTADFMTPSDATITLDSGAFANVLTQALPRNDFDGPDATLNTFLMGVNNVVIGGVKQCAVYAANSPDIIYGNGFINFTTGKEYCMAPLAYAGGSFVTETGLDLPSTAGGTPMWVGSLFQNQTLDRDYEERSQGVVKRIRVRF